MASVRVFISYSSHDADLAQTLKVDLERAGARVWLDHEQLVPGTPHWQVAVRNGIGQATHVIYVASETAAISPYVIDEISLARGKAKVVIPFWARGEAWYDCAPLGWGLSQYVEGRSDHFGAGVAALLKALGLDTGYFSQETVTDIGLDLPIRLVDLGFQLRAIDGISYALPPLIAIPAGKFRLGSDQPRDPYAGYVELERVGVELPEFSISCYPVTVAEYLCFVQSGKCVQPASRFNALSWVEQLADRDHPVVNVSLGDMTKYADWLSEVTGKLWRLPTAAEWEKAARYDPDSPSGVSSERLYPWGDEFEPSRCNTDESGLNRTSPVGWYSGMKENLNSGRQSGASPCGVEDMSGNVWEWVTDTNHEYGWQSHHTRGGCWGGNRVSVRATNRHVFSHSMGSVSLGFRLICVAEESKSLIPYDPTHPTGAELVEQ